MGPYSERLQDHVRGKSSASPTGREIALRSIHTIRQAGGREAETQALSDCLGLLQQLGVAPSAPPRPQAVGSGA